MTRPLELTAADRVMVIAPHPDDESLACGGLIQRAREANASVRVLLVTDGDNNPWPQRAMERRLIIRDEDRAAWGRRRREEAKAAVTRLGLQPTDVHCAGLPDQGLTAELIDGKTSFRSFLRHQLSELSPTIIASPSMLDCHPDHSAIAVLLRLTLRETGSSPKLYEYMVHGHASGEQRLVELSADQVRIKAEAIACHHTQTLLSRGRFMSYATATEVFFESCSAVDHPVISVTRNAAGWRIDLQPRRKRDIATDVWIDLLGCDGPKLLTHLRLDDDESELIVPHDSLQNSRQLFAKRSGGRGFFDEAGWREFPLE